jgi:hypothetical protein
MTAGFIHGALEHGPPGASGAVMHPVVPFAVTDREFRPVDVVVQRVEARLVEPAVLREFRVQPLQCVEILALIGVKKRLTEVEILQTIGQAWAGRER